jgi:hypothetical protein
MSTAVCKLMVVLAESVAKALKIACKSAVLICGNDAAGGGVIILLAAAALVLGVLFACPVLLPPPLLHATSAKPDADTTKETKIFFTYFIFQFLVVILLNSLELLNLITLCSEFI